MSDFGLFGGGNQFQQGPFSFGPSMFDLAQLLGAGTDNQTAITNRYDQLGLGGSTMEQQDIQGSQLQTNAAIGQEQVADVNNPAINTSLQTPVSTGNPTTASSISSLIKGLGSL